MIKQMAIADQPRSPSWRERLAFAAAEFNLRRIALELCAENSSVRDEYAREELAAREKLDHATIGYVSSELNRQEPSLTIRLELDLMEHFNSIGNVLDRCIEPGIQTVEKRHAVLKRAFACANAERRKSFADDAIANAINRPNGEELSFRNERGLSDQDARDLVDACRLLQDRLHCGRLGTEPGQTGVQQDWLTDQMRRAAGELNRLLKQTQVPPQRTGAPSMTGASELDSASTPQHDADQAIPRSFLPVAA